MNGMIEGKFEKETVMGILNWANWCMKIIKY